MRSLARQIAFVVLVFAVSACQGGDSPAPSTIVDNDYRLKHPIVVEPATATLQLGAGPMVSEEGRHRLHDFAGAFIRRGSGAV
jgi:type IV pilus biogenesis protein CpaD/CtpE